MQFLNPNVFYMMLIPLILLIVLVLTSKDMMKHYFPPGIRVKLQVNSTVIGKSGRNILFFIVLILFILALARPVTNKVEHNVKQKLVPIVVAIDLSKSMQATDIYPNRISLAKKKLKDIISFSKNSMIGVVLFAKDSFILSPVTEDFVSLEYIVDNMDTNLNFPNGSNIFSVLETTKFMLNDFKVKNLIILSDGGNKSEYINEIEYAKNENIAIYSIGLATKQGAAIPDKNGYLTDKNGNIVTVKLNDSIKTLAFETGGGYIDYTLNSDDVNSIITRITTESLKEELSKQNITTYTELFYYPIGLAIFLLLLSFSSMPKLKKQNLNMILVLISLAIVSDKADALELDFQRIEKAQELYEKKEYEKSAKSFSKLGNNPQALYNMANALYKSDKYEEAIDVYSKVVSDDKNLELNKLYNIGNSYVKLNKLQNAKEFYEKALKIKEDQQTKENLELVKKELEKQKQQNKKQDQKENQDNQDKNKQENKDSQKKNEDQKNSEQKSKEQQKQNKEKENKKDQNSQDSQQQEPKENKDEKKDSKASKKHNKEQTQNQESEQLKQLKQEHISDMEERKWMEQLQNKKTPIFIQKAPTEQKGSSDVSQPW